MKFDKRDFLRVGMCLTCGSEVRPCKCDTAAQNEPRYFVAYFATNGERLGRWFDARKSAEAFAESERKAGRPASIYKEVEPSAPEELDW